MIKKYKRQNCLHCDGSGRLWKTKDGKEVVFATPAGAKQGNLIEIQCPHCKGEKDD